MYSSCKLDIFPLVFSPFNLLWTYLHINQWPEPALPPARGAVCENPRSNLPTAAKRPDSISAATGLKARGWHFLSWAALQRPTIIPDARQSSEASDQPSSEPPTTEQPGSKNVSCFAVQPTSPFWKDKAVLLLWWKRWKQSSPLLRKSQKMNNCLTSP